MNKFAFIVRLIGHRCVISSAVPMAENRVEHG